MTSKPVPEQPASDVLGRALLPLRAFLGVTFCFAGLEKLANPRFFDAADPASIQAQLAGAARRSPVHALSPGPGPRTGPSLHRPPGPAPRPRPPVRP